MKKIVAMILALCLLGSVAAFAEETAVPAYTINMDAIPEGYHFQPENVGNDLIYVFTSDVEGMPIYYGSVAFSSYFEGYTLNTAEMTEEEKAQAVELLAGDYNNPTCDFSRKTSHGTDLIILSENDAANDTTEIVTVWQGYMITIGILYDGEITDEMVDTAVQILSDLWVVAQ